MFQLKVSTLRPRIPQPRKRRTRRQEGRPTATAATATTQFPTAAPVTAATRRRNRYAAVSQISDPLTQQNLNIFEKINHEYTLIVIELVI
jgi:hypothetical protein